MEKSKFEFGNETPKFVIQKGQRVKINQGFGNFTEGVVRSFDDKKKNLCGFKAHYEIEVTGGVDCFGKPAKIGQIQTVHHSDVSVA